MKTLAKLIPLFGLILIASAYAYSFYMETEELKARIEAFKKHAVTVEVTNTKTGYKQVLKMPVDELQYIVLPYTATIKITTNPEVFHEDSTYNN